MHINIGPCIVNKPCTVNAVLGCPRLYFVSFMPGLFFCKDNYVKKQVKLFKKANKNISFFYTTQHFLNLPVLSNHCHPLQPYHIPVFGGVSFSVRLLSVLRGHSVFSSPSQRPMTSDFEGFLYQTLSITFIFPILIFEKELVFFLFNVEC